MAMFSAYFDASGHPASGAVYTVAGFASTVKKWDRFDREWKSILDSEGIACFHMTDFVASRGDFAHGWKGETKRRREFVDRLVSCLKINVNKSFRTTLILADYAAVNKDYKLVEFLGPPYALCCMVNTFTLREWAKRKGAEKNLLYYFEDGDKDKGEFERRHKHLYKVNPKFLDKAEARPFQAADFAGWKVRKSIEGALKEDHNLEKGVLLLNSVAMLRTIPNSAGVLNADALTKYCRAWKVKKRT